MNTNIKKILGEIIQMYHNYDTFLFSEMKQEMKTVYKKHQATILPMVVVLILGIVILLFKLWAYYLTNSMALKSDALESLVNILAGSFALFSLFYGNRPADQNHPYGHGKIEFFSAFFEGGLIVLASILILYEAIEKLILGIELKEITFGLVVNFLAGSMNGIMGFWLVRIGKRKKSSALEADGYHLLSDFYTTLGIFLGLILVYYTNIWQLDPIIAIIMGGLLFFTGIKIIFKAIFYLLDTENPEMIQKIIRAMNQVNDPRVITAHATRIIQSGNYVHIDIHLVLPEYFTINEANLFIHNYEIQVLKIANLKGEFHTHIDPCKRYYCKICRVKNCPIRVDKFQYDQPLTYQQAISWPKEDKDRITLMH